MSRWRCAVARPNRQGYGVRRRGRVSSAAVRKRPLFFVERMTGRTISIGVAVFPQLHYDAVNRARECEGRRIGLTDRRTTVATAEEPAGRSVDRPCLWDLRRAHAFAVNE